MRPNGARRFLFGIQSMNEPDDQIEEAQPRDLAHADVGIVSALPIELSPFIGLLERRRSYSGGRFKFIGGVLNDKIRVVVAQKAIGFAKARSAAQALVDAHTPDWILSAGFSGALQDDLQVGDVVLADSIVDRHGHELKVDLKMASDEQRRMFVGRFVTADEVVLKADDKKELGSAFSAIAVDLESLAVAQVCKETETKYLAVRAISDDTSEDLPPEILSIMGETGSVRLGAAVGSIWKRFGSVKDMWHLRERAVAASRKLAKFLSGLAPQLTPGSADAD